MPAQPSPPRRRLSAPHGVLIGLLALVLLALLVPARGDDTSREPPKDATSTAEPTRERASTPPARAMIPPGRERAVLAWLEPLREGGFAGRSASGISIERDHLRVRLTGGEAGCSLPAWSGPGGVLAIGRGAPPEQTPAPRGEVARAGFYLSWWTCDDDGDAARATALLEQLATRYHDDIWGAGVDVAAPAPATAAAAAIPEGWRVSEPVPVARLGVVGPAAAALGVSPSRLTLLTFAVGLLTLLALTLLEPAPAPAPPEDDEPPRGRGRVWRLVALAGLVALGLLLRAWALQTAAFDGDEVWARAARVPVFDDDHDAWVHPPLYRLLQFHWAAYWGARGEPSLALLRTPAAMASGLAALLIASFAARARADWFGVAAVAGFALSPALATATVLARPYGLATLLCALALLAAFARRPRWSIAVTSAGALAWCDLVFGAVTAVAVAVAAASWYARVGRSPRSTRARARGPRGAVARAVVGAARRGARAPWRSSAPRTSPRARAPRTTPHRYNMYMKPCLSRAARPSPPRARGLTCALQTRGPARVAQTLAASAWGCAPGARAGGLPRRPRDARRRRAVLAKAPRRVARRARARAALRARPRRARRAAPAEPPVRAHARDDPRGHRERVALRAKLIMRARARSRSRERAS
ncbi:MAG: hypothetical protein H6713_20600 [Myxococcales bacterium]|nr:hypothetical protein [Myxococcales bacterium]